jgi:glycosyltransferase involved in cell wall biosynthesis
MRVLAVCSYPVEAAATRFRLAQYVDPLREHGIELTIKPFLDSRQFADLYGNRGVAGKVVEMIGPISRRIAGIVEARKYDLLFVQREAMLFGPGIFERLYQTSGQLPMVLDLDDATYVPYISPSYGWLGSSLKFFGKTDNLIKRADLVICGNRFIAEYVESKGTASVVIPTVVDTNVFTPVEKTNDIPVIGWIGTHSTFPFLEALFPVLEELAKTCRFKLRIIGSGKMGVRINGIEIENLDWSLEREVADFQNLDIGLYPIRVSASANEEWIKGKSGFKAVQYLAVGVPFVMSPVGVCAEIGIDGETHFSATTDQEWFVALERLLASAELRRSFGQAGREFAIENYNLLNNARKLASSLKKVGGRP